MPASGSKKASDPGTHMSRPAIDWSSRAERPPRRGTSA